MFSLKDGVILTLHPDVLRLAVPLLLYLGLMLTLAFGLSFVLKFSYANTATLSFTAASNNFELVIAMVISVFGIASGAPLAAVVGPSVEVPALIGWEYVSLRMGRKLYPRDALWALSNTPTPARGPQPEPISHP
jgi:ACR3 family arsenite transporter